MGCATIPLPIPNEKYAHCMELLEGMRIGNAAANDCYIDQLNGAPPYLDVLEKQEVNIDELDFLTRSLDRYTADEMAKFQSVATSRSMSAGDLDRLIEAQEQKFGEMFALVQSNQNFMAHADEFKAINDELASLKSKKALLLERRSRDTAANRRADEAIELMSAGTAEMSTWNESVNRQLVETVKIFSKEKILVILQGGSQIKQSMIL